MLNVNINPTCMFRCLVAVNIMAPIVAAVIVGTLMGLATYKALDAAIEDENSINKIAALAGCAMTAATSTLTYHITQRLFRPIIFAQQGVAAPLIEEPVAVVNIPRN